MNTHATASKKLSPSWQGVLATANQAQKNHQAFEASRREFLAEIIMLHQHLGIDAHASELKRLGYKQKPEPDSLMMTLLSQYIREPKISLAGLTIRLTKISQEADTREDILKRIDNSKALQSWPAEYFPLGSQE